MYVSTRLTYKKKSMYFGFACASGEFPGEFSGAPGNGSGAGRDGSLIAGAR